MPALPQKPLLRVDEVAAYWDVSERAVRSWVQDGKLQHVRIGGPDGPIRIPREVAMTFIFTSGTT